jgi:hypothetical protein
MKQVRYQVRDQVRDQVGDQVGDQVEAQVRDQVWVRSGSVGIRSRLRSGAQSGSGWDQVREQTR